MAIVGDAFYDKYDPSDGGFRAKSAIAWVEADLNKIFAVGLDSSGNVVKGAGQTGILGVVVLNKAKAIGDVIDVMTDGEIVGVALSDGTTGIAAGTVVYAIPASGLLSVTATGNKRIGWTVEATRLVVRTLPLAGVATGAAIVALTDSSGGSADNTIAAITQVANAGSADVGPTANAIADLTAKVNALRSALVAAGIIAA